MDVALVLGELRKFGTIACVLIFSFKFFFFQSFLYLAYLN